MSDFESRVTAPQVTTEERAEIESAVESFLNDVDQEGRSISISAEIGVSDNDGLTWRMHRVHRVLLSGPAAQSIRDALNDSDDDV